MSLSLIVRRTIRASPERLFQAWTEPAQIASWWGPVGVVCPEAAVEPRKGGRYHIDNRLADGTLIRIQGEFLAWNPPHSLSYSWSVCSNKSVPLTDVGADAVERVSVRFVPKNVGVTEVVVVHERIASEELRQSHQHGWDGCIDGLVAFAGRSGSP